MPEVTKKICSRCKIKLPAAATHFHRSKSGKYGLQNWCKECASSEGRKAGKRRHDQNHHRISKYGIGIEQYEHMEKVQDSKCAICGCVETQMQRGKVIRLSIDHNHSTGKIRALLCHNCNIGLGNFKENEASLLKAVLYLRKWGS